MTKLYKKSEITFAILWIVAYVVLSSLADQLSESLGVVKSVTAALHIFLSLILFFWIRNNHLSEKYGFCKSSRRRSSCIICRWPSVPPRLSGAGPACSTAFRAR